MEPTAIPVAAGDATVDTDNPWPGLLAFRETDQGYFQGRQAETEELLRLVMRERLTVLFGLSGLGKSSLLQAGLFPHLRRQNVFPVYIRLDFSSARPRLVGQVGAAVAREAAVHGIEAPSPGSGETLWEYFHRDGNNFWNSRNRPVMPLLVLDQFEEIFTLGRIDPDRAEATEAFVDQLADLAEGRPPAALKAWMDEHPEEAGAFAFGRHHYKILLSIREDFLPELEALRARMPAVALNRLRLRRMNGEAALLVVNQARHLVDSLVARQIVRFVAADRRSLPLSDLEVEPALLSVVCRELNNKRLGLGEPRITAGLLEGSQEQVLTDFYERSTKDLPPEVQSFIEDHLLTVSGYRDSVALENALSTPGVTRQSLDQLVERRLVRREDRGGAQRLELTHDLLAGVVRASRDRRRLEAEAERARLALVRAQEQQQQELLQAKEEERQELQRAREREKRERDQRDLRRFRIAAVVFGLLFVAAIGAGAWAIHAQREAANLRDAAAERAANEADQDRERAQEESLLAKKNAAEAQKLANAANVNETLAEKNRSIANAALSRSSAHDAADLAGNDNVAQSMAYLAQALRIDPGSVVARNWVADLVLRKSWWSPQPPLVHGQGYGTAAFSQDGRRVVTVVSDVAQVWDASTRRPVGTPLKQKAPISSASLNADGRRVVTVSSDSTAQVWEADTGHAVGDLLKHKSRINSAALSADGRRVVTACDDRTAQVWSADTGKTVGEALKHADPVNIATFSPDGRRVVTAAYYTAQVWDADTGKSVGDALQHKGYVVSAVFSADGRRVVTASNDSTAQVWSADTGKAVGGHLQHKGMVHSAAFSADGRRVVTASYDFTAQVWDADTGKSVGAPLRHANQVQSAGFSPDSRRVVTASADRTVQIWDARTGKSAGAPLPHPDLPIYAAFSPDGRRLVTVSVGGTAQVWEEYPTGPAGPSLERKKGLYSADGGRVVTGSEDSAAIQVWQADTGKPLGTLRLQPESIVLAFSPDGRRLVTASEDRTTAQLWDADTGKPFGAPIQHKEEVILGRFSTDSRRLVTVSVDGTAKVWDAATGKPGVVLRDMAVAKLATFSADGRRLVTTVSDGVAQVWDADTGKPVGAHLEQKASVNSAGTNALKRELSIISATFSADGRRLVTASQDTTAQVWEVATGKPVGVPLEHKREVISGAFSPDGRRVVTASYDHTSQVWEVDTGKPVGAPLQHKESVNSAAFSPEGLRVVTASSDQTAQVWEADTGKPVGGPLQHEDSVKSAVFSADGRRVVTVTSDQTARVWGVLVDSGSPEDSSILATLAEVVGGYYVNEFAALKTFTRQEQAQRLDKLRQLAAKAPDRPGTLVWFLRRFLSVPETAVQRRQGLPPRK